MVALCQNCHKKLDHGNEVAREEVLKALGKIEPDLPQMSSKKEHFFCYRFQLITSKSETIISILTTKNRSEKSSAESQSRKM